MDLFYKNFKPGTFISKFFISELTSIPNGVLKTSIS